MLVLSVKTTERILIGDDIAVMICRIGNNVVRVGIDAPKSTRVIREELLPCLKQPIGYAGSLDAAHHVHTVPRPETRYTSD
jgi:carbon storage regulator